MKKFLNVFFVTLGVIFFLLMLCAAYFYIADPYNLRPLLFGSGSAMPEVFVETDIVKDSNVDTKEDGHPLLDEGQEEALENIGIDPRNLPTEITPAQEMCFEDVLGKERVTEIKTGAEPTAIELFRALVCLE
ncbi:hypothetical protein N8083_01865 [Candidatus Pacebacteria bacterium]|nr:hypothetical protein [Candidatus Paceibacterota bacterium]